MQGSFQSESDKHGRVGRFVTSRIRQESFQAYVPRSLPPTPKIDTAPFEGILERSNQALGRLDGITAVLPDPDLFVYMYIRKEALLSSQIEGTQSSLSDLLLYEGHESIGVPLDDVQEVSRYVAAMAHGLQRLRSDFPLSLRLIREIHSVMMTEGRGAHQTPGEFRTSQNWIGGTRPGNATFVPPPPEELNRCLGDLEKFMHDESSMSVLIKTALVHVQFETIHPFLDGNGRLGRLLITFLLCAKGVLQEPSLYLSLYLKRNRERYYALLQKVRMEGAWEEWIEFFLLGLEETSIQAVQTARSIVALLTEDRQKIQEVGRAAPSTLLVHHLMQRRPLISIASAATALKLSIPTIGKSMEVMQNLGIVTEATGRQKKRLFAYNLYLDILSQGTEPLAKVYTTER